VKITGNFLMALLTLFVFSSIAYAGHTAGIFGLPFDPNQRWNVPNCTSIGYSNQGALGQIFMELYEEHPSGVPKYHLAEDWNGTCGGSSDMGAVLYAIADGQVQEVDDATSTNGGFGKLLLIRHTFPDGTQRDVLYEHILNIETNPRTGAKFKKGDPVYRGDTIARLGDANGAYPGAAHLHFEMRRNLSVSLYQDPYYRPLRISDALRYTSPSLFTDDRRRPLTITLQTNAWTLLPLYFNAPSLTAYIDYNGEKYSLYRAMAAGWLHQYVYVQVNGQWYPYTSITDVFFESGKTYAFYSFVAGATLTILVPGNNYQGDRAKLDMIHVAAHDQYLRNANIKTENYDVNPSWWTDPNFDLHYMRFEYISGNSLVPTYIFQATNKANPL
jgi:hypothetical protein